MGGKVGRWVAKLVARLLSTAALWVRIQTSPENSKWATEAMEWPIHSSPPKIYKKRLYSTKVLLTPSADQHSISLPSFPIQLPSADYSQFHCDNFGNFLRRLAFALASTFLYALLSLGVFPTVLSNVNCVTS